MNVDDLNTPEGINDKKVLNELLLSNEKPQEESDLEMSPMTLPIKRQQTLNANQNI